MNDCVIWEGSKTRDGYGRLTHNSKTVLAHRLAYCQANGLMLSDITGLEIRHKCDVRDCVNPLHLEPGSHADNMNDMKVRGRSARGERGGGAKLSEADVLDIIQRIASKERQRDIAKTFGVSPTAIADIARGDSWAHVDVPRVSGKVGERNGRAKVCEDDVKNIRALYESGVSQIKLADMFGITQVAVSKIIRRVTWANV